MKIQFLSSAIGYFRGVSSESRKITFPTKKETVNNTIIVIIAIIVGMAALALIDLIAVNLLEKIII